MPLSPLAYFGNREGLLDDISSLIQQYPTPFECLYDLFSGSGSFSLQAMSLGLAKRYVVNDVYEPLTTFWRQVKDNPEKLIEAYSILQGNYLKTSDKKSFCEEQQENFNKNLTANPISRAACFAFLINHAKKGMPLINSKHNNLHLCCKWTLTPSDLAKINEFSNAVKKTNELFNSQQEVIFTNHDFNHYKEQITAQDLVILDPPYPDMPDAEEKAEAHIYQRTEPKAILQKNLQSMLEYLKENNTPFLLFYGVLGMPNAYPIQYEENHYGRIAGGLNHPYGEYVENVYISPHFAPFLQAPRILRYDNIVEALIVGQSYQAIAEAMKKKVETDIRWHKPFPILFEKKANHFALKPALINHDNRVMKLNYETLNQQVNQLAHYLLSEKISKGKLVALMLDNQVDYVKSILAVWKTGAAYIPISLTSQHKIEDATQLVKQIIDKAQPHYIIASASLKCYLLESTQPKFVWSNELLISHSKNNPHTTKTIRPDDLAYVIYTSGSIGLPKAVAIAHRGLAYCLQAHQQQLELNENDQIALIAQFDFDASLMEVMMALGIGGALHLIPKPWIDDESQLRECFNKHAINTAIFIPTKLKQLEPYHYPKLTKIIITGEGFDESLLQPWSPQERLLVNGYGLTETTICTTLGRYVDGELTIGAPIMGTEILLLDKHYKLINETNQSGEICVAGQSLARGYWGDEELTQLCFKTITHPFTKQPVRILKTGDMAVYSNTKPNELIYQGRLNNQMNKTIHHTGSITFESSNTNFLLGENQAPNYLTKFFAHKPEKAKTLWQFIQQNSLINNISHTPLILKLLCYLWEKNTLQFIDEQRQFSYTQLYNQFYDHLDLVSHYNENKQVGYRFKEAVNECLKRAAFLALKANQRGTISSILWQKAYQDITTKIDNQIEQIIANCSNLYLQNYLKEGKLGGLDWFIAIKNSCFLTQVFNCTSLEAYDYEFIHITLQDFFAAHFMKEHLLINSNDDDIVSLIASHRYDVHFASVWAFIAGLLASEKHFEALTHYLTLLHNPLNDLLEINNICLLLRCFEETGYPPEVMTNQKHFIKQLKDFIHSELLNTNPSIRLVQALKDSPQICKQMNFLPNVIQKKIAEPNNFDSHSEVKECIEQDLDFNSTNPDEILQPEIESISVSEQQENQLKNNIFLLGNTSASLKLHILMQERRQILLSDKLMHHSTYINSDNPVSYSNLIASIHVAPKSSFYGNDSISKRSENTKNDRLISSTQNLITPTFKKELKNEKHLMTLLQQFIPVDLTLGKAHDQGDCFFDALAQCINKINNTDINTDKYLRMLCHDYYGKNKAIVDKWNTKDYGGIDKRDDYAMVQYTAEECKEHFHDRSPIWGRPAIEGIILCNQLDLRGFCVIEILEHPETKQPIPSFHWVNKESYTSISESEAREKLNNPEIPTLVVEQNSLHFVPLLKTNEVDLNPSLDLENKLKP